MFLKMIFLSEYQFNRKTFVDNILDFNHSFLEDLVKMCIIFTGRCSNCLTICQKILSGGSCGYKYLQNFNYITMKFHYCCHANVQASPIILQIRAKSCHFKLEFPKAYVLLLISRLQLPHRKGVKTDLNFSMDKSMW